MFSDPKTMATLVSYTCKSFIKLTPDKENTLNIITPFRTKDKMHGVLFPSPLLAIAKEQFHVTVIYFVYLEYKQFLCTKTCL